MLTIQYSRCDDVRNEKVDFDVDIDIKVDIGQEFDVDVGGATEVDVNEGGITYGSVEGNCDIGTNFDVGVHCDSEGGDEGSAESESTAKTQRST